VIIRPLPRSLDPLPNESLAGFVLRSAHRLDLSPARIASLTGLSPRRSGHIAITKTLFNLGDRTTDFAEATRLTAHEVTQLTLASLGDRYPPLATHRHGRTRKEDGIFIKESWVFTRSTRYCPRCLAGDGTQIQQRHGGAWNRLWRLPILFACPIHRRLLQYTCPACGQLVHHRQPETAALVPRAKVSGLHPTACRAPTPSGTLCGHRLDAFTDGQGRLPRGWDHQAMILLQQRLLNLIHSEGPQTTPSVGSPTTPSQYFVDLRIVSCLLTASWPAGRQLITESVHARTVDEHAAQARRNAKAAQEAGSPTQTAAYFDRPPLRPSACAAQLTLADRVLQHGDPDALRQVLRPLVEAAPQIRQWIRGFLADDGPCSAGLQTAIGTEVGAKHVIERVGLSWIQRQPAPTLRFGPEHLPQRLPDPWYDKYFTELSHLDQQFLRRAVPVLLARACTGQGIKPCAGLLDLPPRTASYAVGITHQQLSATRRRRNTFETALNALTTHLDTSTKLTNYGRRRAALKRWSIPTEDWTGLIDGLVGKPFRRKSTKHTDWSDAKRLLASTWVWTHITEGEPHYSPTVRPDSARPRPGSELSIYILKRWPQITSGYGHYAELRERLDEYAQQLAQRIDIRTA